MGALGGQLPRQEEALMSADAPPRESLQRRSLSRSCPCFKNKAVSDERRSSNKPGGPIT